jgi:branched-chain amino acid aminotransferase
MNLAKSSMIPMHERRLERHDLYIADECFLTGTAAEVIAVTKIDGRKIGTGEPGPVTKKLLAAFHKFVRLVEQQ